MMDDAVSILSRFFVVDGAVVCVSVSTTMTVRRSTCAHLSASAWNGHTEQADSKYILHISFQRWNSSYEKDYLDSDSEP